MEFITDTISWMISAPLICIGWLIVGGVAGALARRIMGAQDRPLVSDIILGLVGAVVGGFIAGLIGLGTPQGGLPLLIVNLIIATGGAIVLIFLGQLVRGRR